MLKMFFLPSSISYLQHQTPSINLFPSEWLTNFLANGSYNTNWTYMALFFPWGDCCGVGIVSFVSFIYYLHFKNILFPFSEIVQLFLASTRGFCQDNK